MIKGLIFDLDGTLVTMKVKVTELRQAALRELEACGVETERFSADQVSIQDMLDEAESRLGHGTYVGLRSRVYAAFDDLEMGWMRSARPVGGVANVLSRLRSMPLKLAALTNSGGLPTRYALREFSLERYFDFVFTRDDLPSMKPRPDGMLFAVRKMGLEKDEVLYIGDSVVDVKAARQAGIKIVSVCTGSYDMETLRRSGPDYCVASLGEVQTLLSSHWTGS